AMSNDEPHKNCSSSGQQSGMVGKTWAIERTTVPPEI
ncbi:unnamed protein product, partial [Rotaria socialis]